MGEGRRGLSKQYIVKEVEGSLKRLRTDRIDLYQAHFDDETAAQSETLDAFSELIAQGKVRTIGASNFSAQRLRSARHASAKYGLARYESLQPEYNLYDREGFERELQALCVGEEIGVIPYFSLASGFLSGKYRSEADTATSARKSLLQKYFTPRGMRILVALDRVAADLGAKPAQIALAWLIAQPAVTAPIASATSLEQLDDLVAATRLRLDESAIAALDAASAYSSRVA
jgi:aryl-alcohol dehydrogenase-like predicted oxidoreductase